MDAIIYYPFYSLCSPICKDHRATILCQGVHTFHAGISYSGRLWVSCVCSLVSSLFTQTLCCRLSFFPTKGAVGVSSFFAHNEVIYFRQEEQVVFIKGYEKRVGGEGWWKLPRLCLRGKQKKTPVADGKLPLCHTSECSPVPVFLQSQFQINRLWNLSLMQRI